MAKARIRLSENAQQAFQESLYTDFQLALFKNFGYQPADLPDDEASDDVNKNGTDEVFPTLIPHSTSLSIILGISTMEDCFGCSIK